MVRQANSSGSSRAKNLSPSLPSSSSGSARKGSRGGRNKYTADVRGSDRLSDSLNQANQSNHEQQQSQSWFDQFQTPEALENMQFFVLLNSFFMIIAVIPWSEVYSAIKDLFQHHSSTSPGGNYSQNTPSTIESHF
ncbi:unnamed protein product [Allacma fusca]|uniref:Uncharacterized protein n=1 Tax=Allacma fusca TaxID=39272 RepID=A0A8J2KWW0_9HEXA|nr:unnamed protein product [Allacma fusca]